MGDKDTIYRQAAIDALARFVPYAICDESTESYTNGLTDAYNLILQLPSAQPDVPDTNVGDCSDCIKHGGDWECDHMHCRKGRLPSAHPKKGKWISVHDDIFADKYYCSCCKMEPICNDTEYILSNFCPNCGADMRGEQ